MVPIMVPMLDTVVNTDEVRLWRSVNILTFCVGHTANQLSLTYGTSLSLNFLYLWHNSPVQISIELISLLNHRTRYEAGQSLNSYLLGWPTSALIDWDIGPNLTFFVGYQKNACIYGDESIFTLYGVS